MRLLLFTLTLTALPGFLSAQDGAQLYSTYCAACHGPDGKGAPGGNFPPLAGSPWIAGTPDRAVKVVLHGLEGPIQVLGQNYDLAMPPHGAVLGDEAIAAILSHVRSAYGNGATAVTSGIVEKIRKDSADREKPWTAPEILKLHPLQVDPSPLKNLISRTYFGEWKDLPDFTKMVPANVEEEHDGMISLDHAIKRGDHFGLVWEGDFEAPENGDYEFYFDADDGGSMAISGNRIAVIKGIGPLNGSRSKTAKVSLAKGLHPIRIEYYEVLQNDDIKVGWKGPGMKAFAWLTKDKGGQNKKRPEIFLSPERRPIIYRNFIAGSTARGIGVGFPHQVNLVWSADTVSPQMIWRGKFIDAGRHWTDRGQGFEAPAAEHSMNFPPHTLAEGGIFKGYQLDPDGNPTFKIQVGNQMLSDKWSASSDGSLQRTISATPGIDRRLVIADEAMKGLKWSVNNAGQQASVLLKGGGSITIIYTFAE